MASATSLGSISVPIEDSSSDEESTKRPIIVQPKLKYPKYKRNARSGSYNPILDGQEDSDSTES